MDFQKIFYIAGTVFFVCAAVLAIVIIVEIFGSFSWHPD